MYASSPKWPKAWLSFDDLNSLLNILVQYIQPSPYGPKQMSLNHGLHFTGGEPFLNSDLLLQAVSCAHELGIPSVFVETNAFWCRNEDDTRDRMRQLQAAGLSGMLVSVNPFILEFVPFERTLQAISVGTEVFGQGLMVYQVDYFQQFRRLGFTGRVPLQVYLRTVGLREATSRIELLPLGRAVYALSEWFRHEPASTFFGETCAFDLSRNYHNHWDNYGNVLAGFCSGIALGNLLEQPDLYEQGLDLEYDYPLLQTLMNEGVEGLYHLARTDFDYRELDEGYISKCHLCVDIRKYIVGQTHEFKELRPLEFYAKCDAV
jgi:hypothetical protein